MAWPLLSPKQGTWGVPSCGLSTSSSCWALVAAGRSIGELYPDQSAPRTGCYHWPPTSTFCGRSAVWGQSNGAPVWSVALHWVSRLRAFPGGASLGQPPPFYAQGHSAWAIKQSKMAATHAGLGVSQVKLSCAPKLAVAKCWIWGHLARGEGVGGSLRPAVTCLGGFSKL